MTQTLITRAGLVRSREELEHLTTTCRREVTERIRQAVSDDRNIVENGEYHDAREEQALLERQIAVLQERIAAAEVVDPDGENGVLDVGEDVLLRDLENGDEIRYHLVGSLEADPFAGRISAASPLGRALLGRGPGETAIVDAPGGRMQFRILDVEPATSGAVR
jgi:transcription elongation factor GreA